MGLFAENDYSLGGVSPDFRFLGTSLDKSRRAHALRNEPRIARDTRAANVSHQFMFHLGGWWSRYLNEYAKRWMPYSVMMRRGTWAHKHKKARHREAAGRNCQAMLLITRVFLQRSDGE